MIATAKKFLLNIELMAVCIALSGCSPQSPKQALGMVDRERVALTAPVSEIIEALPVKEGQTVKKGEVLVVFNRVSQQALVDKARALQNKAEAALSQLLNGERAEDVLQAKANWVNAKAKFTDSEKQYQRVAELVARRLASQSDFDSALAQRDAAKASFEAAEQNWKKLSAGYRTEEIEQARAELAAAEQELAYQRQKLSELTIVATRDGILDSLPYHRGERVPAGSAVAILQANSVAYARVYVPEPYRAKLTVGKQVTVHVDGLSEPLTGTVRWLSVEAAFTPYSSMSEQDRERLVYLTEIDLPSTSVRLPAGIPVQVNLE